MRLGYDKPDLQAEARVMSFNEAEAHAPRIHGKKTLPQFPVNWASMRPRRMRLGYLINWTDERQVSFPGFNEAEAHAPRILILQQSQWQIYFPLQ